MTRVLAQRLCDFDQLPRRDRESFDGLVHVEVESKLADPVLRLLVLSGALHEAGAGRRAAKKNIVRHAHCADQ